MEVTVACHGTYHVAVKPPELFHRDKGANLSDTLLTVLVSGGKAGDASVVPENGRSHMLLVVVSSYKLIRSF